MKLIVQVMISMLPEKKSNTYSATKETSSKMKAFYEMQKLRSRSSEYGIQDTDSELHAALEKKYGKYMTGDTL